MIQLTDIPIHKKYLIREVSGDALQVARIQELGLIPGCDIQILQKLPFYGPYIVRARSTFVSLRLEETKLIFVTEFISEVGVK